MELKDRLEMIIQALCNGNQTLFGKRIGLAQPSIAGWLRRGTMDFEKVAFAFPELSAEWLLRGEGEMLKSDNGKQITIYTDSKVATNGSSIDSHNANGDLVKENEELRAEVKQLRERCDKLTDRLLDM